MSDTLGIRRDREGAKARRKTRRLFFLKENHFARASRLRLFAVSSLLLAGTIGCHDIGTGGNGELVVPQHTLREIDSVEPSQFAATQPTTAPSTLPTTRASTRPMREVSLTIADVRRMALHNNLDLQVDLLNPSISRENFSQEEAAYEWTFTTDAGFSSTDSPTANKVAQQLSGSQSENWRLTPGLVLPLRTGGTIDLSVPMNQSSVQGTSANVLNPLYTSDFTARLSQPLLRGGGIDV